MKNCLMVSLVFFDSEQLLTYNQPSKNASKYPKLACAKIAILHSTDFGGLIRPLNHIFLGLSMFGAHPQGLEGIYIQVSLWVVGEVFLEKCKKPEGGAKIAPPPNETRVKHATSFLYFKSVLFSCLLNIVINCILINFCYYFNLVQEAGNPATLK